MNLCGPNILYIVIDDIGFGAIDTFGGLIDAPNIARLAAGGLRYTNFHTAASYSPTRACLLTGRNHHSAGIPGYTGRLPQNKAAIAAMLHPHGYASFAVGNWTEPDDAGLGFDRFYGMRGDDQWQRAIQETMQPEKPSLGYLEFGACHATGHAPTAESDDYRGKFDMGWDEYRERVLARQIEVGLVPPHTKLAPMLEGVPKWGELTSDQQKRYARMMEKAAAFTADTDARIGRVIDQLAARGNLEDTLIFLLAGSDNHSPLGWALAMNTPFKLCKANTRFGSTRSPLIVHWPNGMKARGGLRHQFHHAIDVVPTILAAAGIDAPRVIHSQRQAPLEGVPMNYTFDQPNAATTHPTQYFELLGNCAIVDGKWKAVVHRDQWELYDLEADPSECIDLVAGMDHTDRKQPLVKCLRQLVGLSSSEAGRYAE
jgi:arylsulfatase A-like enzyme